MDLIGIYELRVSIYAQMQFMLLTKIHFLADVQSLVNFLHALQSWLIYCYDINIIKNSIIVGIDHGNVIIFMKAYSEFLCTHHFNGCPSGAIDDYKWMRQQAFPCYSVEWMSSWWISDKWMLQPEEVYWNTDAVEPSLDIAWCNMT